MHHLLVMPLILIIHRDPAEEIQADNNTQITLPTEGYLRNFRLKVAPKGGDGQPGNTSGNNTMVAFRVNGSDLRTLTIPAGGSGEFSVTLFLPTYFSG